MAIGKSKCAYVVGSCDRYLPGLNALLNSLDMVGNTYPVHVVSCRIPDAYMIEITSAIDYPIIWHPISQQEIDWLGDSEVLMRKRYAMPEKLGDYDAVCILDADMFFLHNVDRYMEIAARTEFILGCGLEQKRRYDHDHNRDADGKFMIDPNKVNGRDLCCAPLFAGRRWYRAMAKSYDLVNDYPAGQGRFKAPDMDAINITLLEAGSYDYTIPMTQQTWTGLHETLMKAHTRLVEIHGEACTEDGQEINIIHGKPWNRKWKHWQVEAQIGMVTREFNASPDYINRSKGSFENLVRLWEKAAFHHKVDVRDFCNYEEHEAR